MYMRYLAYFEMARDLNPGMGVYSGPNVFLCWFYDVYMVHDAKIRA